MADKHTGTGSESVPSSSRTSSPPPLSVPLPRRKVGSDNPPTEPIWAITSVANDDVDAPVTPLPIKCAKHSDGREGVCCKNLRGDDERTLVDPDVVRDVIIGLSDGLTVPFALTAGLSSIGDSRLVVLGGVAELIAGAISMGVGGFLASQGERDHFRYLRAQTRQRVRRSCEGEMEREVHSILGPLGVDAKISREVADCLLTVEGSSHHEDDHESSVSQDTQRSWWRSGSKAQANGDAEQNALRWSEDVGITAFLLKFGEGMEEVPDKRLYISAFTIGMGYFLGGLVPLLPYFFINPAQTALIYSCIITGVILLIFGVVKTHVTGAQGGWGGYFKGAVSTMFVGGAAAAAAYGIVRVMET